MWVNREAVVSLDVGFGCSIPWYIPWYNGIRVYALQHQRVYSLYPGYSAMYT